MSTPDEVEAGVEHRRGNGSHLEAQLPQHEQFIGRDGGGEHRLAVQQRAARPRRRGGEPYAELVGDTRRGAPGRGGDDHRAIGLLVQPDAPVEQGVDRLHVLAVDEREGQVLPGLGA